MRYRSDIDGLRALAVVSVVLFHAGLRPFGGGYIGVDVFFVISGYLITSIIAGEIEQGRFSIVRFYERRVRRILPALFTVVFFASIAASLLQGPQQYKMFAKSVFATALFASNVLFWIESSYFDSPAASKPLLHTWSLAVEEQFYIFFPLFLFIIHRWLKGRYIAWLSPIAVLSFSASVWGVTHDPTATFYLAPTRAWELALGSLLALNAFPQLRQRLWLELLGLLGLVLIAWGVFTFTLTTPFPGTNALFPVGGAALIIYSGTGCETRIGKLLGLKPLVFVGLVSYSLYLWHWPMLVFAQFWSVDELTAAEKGVIVVLSFLLAVLSWRFVELPFRGPAGVVRRVPLFGGTVAAITCFIIFGLFGYFSSGWPSRFPDRFRTINAAIYDDEFPKGLSVVANAPEGIYETNTSSNKVTLFLGDSHAMQYSPRVVSLISSAPEKYKKIIFAVYSSCPPIPGVFTGWNELGGMPSWANSNKCEAVKRYAFSLIRDGAISTVVIAANWNSYFLMNKSRQDERYTNYYSIKNSQRYQFINGSGINVALENLENFIASIPKQIRIVLMIDNPSDIKFDPNYLFKRNIMQGSVRINSDQQWVADQLVGIADRQHVEYISPSKWYCNVDDCETFSADRGHDKSSA